MTYDIFVDLTENQILKIENITPTAIHKLCVYDIQRIRTMVEEEEDELNEEEEDELDDVSKGELEDRSIDEQ